MSIRIGSGVATAANTAWSGPLDNSCRTLRIRLTILGMMASVPYAGSAMARQPSGTAPPASQPLEPAGRPAEDAAPAEPANLFSLDFIEDTILPWGGVRPKLVDAGIDLRIKSMLQFQVNMRGGLETKNGHDFAGSHELNLTLDFEKLLGLQGTTFFIRGKATWGGAAGDFDREKVGALFKTNQDAGGEQPIFVDKWWLTQKLWNDRLELRFGRMEPVKDLFDTSRIMGDEDKYFLNRMLVRNPTIPPDKGLGIYANVDIADAIYARAAVIDAQSRSRRTNFDTAFSDQDWFRVYFELGVEPEFATDKGELRGRWRIGTWYDPVAKRQFLFRQNTRDPNFETGDWGLFMGFDQMIWKENDEPRDRQGLLLAGRYGFADGEYNRVEHFWSVAALYQGPVPSRDKDLLGLGLAQGILSEERRRVQLRADRETVIELFYSFQVRPWLEISPDFQYVINAGGNKGSRNAAIAGVRIRIDL